MESILITPKNNADMQLILSLIERLGMKSTLLSLEEKEDLGLAFLLRETDRTDRVERSEIMAKLGRG